MAGSFDRSAEWIKAIVGRLRAGGGTQAGSGSRARLADEWQLTLTLAPNKSAETPTESAGDLTIESPAWRDAAEGVRATVKWLVAAFAVIGALMFAKGFVTTPTLSWNENRPQLLWALGAALLGLVGIGCFLYLAVRMLRPATYDLNDLAKSLPGFIRVVNSDPSRYLPEGIMNFDMFWKEFGIVQHSVISASKGLEAARRELKDAEEGSPSNPGTVNKAKKKLEKYQELLTSTRRSFHTMKTVRARLLNKAEYWNTSTAFNREGFGLVAAAVVAAFGGIGFQLALATPIEPAKAATSSPATPTVGELIRSDSPSGMELWEQLGLSRCQAVEGSARIAVVVSVGDGSTQNPYVVTTIPTGTCPGQTFTVIDGVARVSLPAKRDIVYTPNYTTSPSTAGKAR